MKKVVFKSTIVAVCALVLMTGSVFAAPIKGTVGLTGSMTALCMENSTDAAWGVSSKCGMLSTMYGFEIIEKEVKDNFVNFEYAGGAFANYMPVRDGSWGPVNVGGRDYNKYPNDFPLYNGILFYDEDLNKLPNIIMGMPPLLVPDVELGVLAGFDFHVTGIDVAAVTFDGGYSNYSFKLTMIGYVVGNAADGWEPSKMVYSLTGQTTNLDYPFTFSLTMSATGEPYEYEYDVPEPGNLLLLGTGLLGATVAARRRRKNNK